MNHNEICMFMDVKLDTQDKRATALRTWTRCQVKIEAIKCVPCFLRLSFQSAGDASELLSVSVNVPGVSISLATSRTKQHSYGLFWTQNRRDCFIYFALETETSCRRHMKWMKKSIKNLELYRQVFLEQRRLSRGPSAQNALGPLPTLPDVYGLDANSFSARISRVSQIYEEIFDGSRISRASIASGIYEEMKPSTELEVPPTVPPLPVHRKRINTFECSPQNGRIDELPRCSTNPESDLAKKKKYKNMLENIFGTSRGKRTASISEPVQQPHNSPVIYENTTPTRGNSGTPTSIVKFQRNSFSSPDLSKLNFLDTCGEAHIADMLKMESEESSGELNVSLDESVIEPVSRDLLLAKITKQLSKGNSLESLNVSEQLPHNFNFSACNTSKINLIGANGAVPNNTLLQKNKILVDDVSGYCVMAPIVKKNTAQIEKQPTTSTSSSTSGYSTGSYSSSSSSCNNEDQQCKTLTQAQIPLPPPPPPPMVSNESGIYEPMHVSSLNSTATPNSGFVDHLYENLLTVKAEQELELPLGYGLSTSTPTESPLVPVLPQKGTPKNQTAPTKQEEDYYQTPRRSIISVDDKIPSYYPNSCDTLKSKRRSPNTDNGSGLRHLRQKRSPTLSTASSSAASSASKTKMQTKKTAAHKISEGVYAVTHGASNGKWHSSNSYNNNDVNNLGADVQQKMEEELLQLAMLQNIDFKFDDNKSSDPKAQPAKSIPIQESPVHQTSIVPTKLEEEYEHCYQAAESATRLLQRYATLAKFGNSPTKSPQHQLQVNQSANIKAQAVEASDVAMTKSIATPSELQPTSGSMKKFASLPRFKKIDFSPLRMRLNNVLQRNQQTQQP
ncbi:flocculation protein FLO11 isoform X2 [Scaptodrosophila lebanonensis]|uniref:Flocculation protein FLO11 isoform X2 n=1 Tax=Drosophila lebanonensis TaxID=7225 RepID=A0A6J2TJU7_DROLE|nr:flocculation protein FLO11 isoform X2 [Scaptodrosophila lebanonensis]